VDIRYADRSDRGKLRLAGPQRAWFLHQVLTQAFEDIAPGEDREAAMITAHGRMIGYLEAYALEDHLLIHYESALREVFPEALHRYVFATQVEIEEISDAMDLMLLVGQGWGAVAGRAARGAVSHPTRGLGAPAGYLWLAPQEKPAVLERLGAEGATPVTEEDLEALRITHGIPRWGKEMDAKTFPQEVGIDAWAVHYDKGCYLGQEAMAKIRFRGKVNRRLARLEGRGLVEGQEVSLEGAKVGRVTSASGDQGLALIRYTVEPGTEVEVAGARVKVAG
jgi:folate-binding protein YgfZ